MEVNNSPRVAVIVGSDSDLPVVEGCIKLLKNLGVQVEAFICSAHRTPDKAVIIAKEAHNKGIEVIIAAAGKAAHLPGVLAANTILPVIGIPVKTSLMGGLDSLLSIVQMPSGVPVATVGIDGAENAALLAVQILSLKHPELKDRLKKFREEMALKVEEKNNALREKLETD